MRIFFSIVIIIFLAVFGQSQISLINPIDESSCPDTDISISLQAKDIFLAGAITLEISYDSAALTFDSLVNKHPAFANLKVNSYKNNDKEIIAFSWYNIYGVIIDSLQIADIHFKYHTGITTLAFGEACEVANSELQILSVEFVNLSITPSILVTNEPENATVFFPESAVFSIVEQGATMLQWQQSMDDGFSFFDIADNNIYSGVNTTTLQILNTSIGMDQAQFRCKLSGDECTTFSKAAKLEVVLPPSDTFDVNFTLGWNSFSSYLNAGVADVDTVFSSVLDGIIFISDGLGRIYYPQLNIKSLELINSKAGYLVKVAGNSTFTFNGYKMMNKALSLTEGWNLMPCLSECNIQIDAMNPDFLSKIIVVKEAVGTNVFWPENNISTLPALEPGKSYWVKLNSDLDFEFQDCTP